MQIAILVTEIIIVLFMFSLGLFIKNFFPSYMDKKGENLATKEDVAEITRRTEEVQKEFKESFELFSSDVQFKYEFFYRQYSGLYCKLYSIIIQSEYVRTFIEKHSGSVISFDEAPFVEISPIHRQNQKIEVKSDEPLKITSSEEWIDTPVSQYNKQMLCDLIIQNDALASQELLKLAISYRFAYTFYTGNKDVKNSEVSDTADEEEFRLIRAIVCSIVKEYNQLRKQLKMTYDENEINDGIPRLR